MVYLVAPAGALSAVLPMLGLPSDTWLWLILGLRMTACVTAASAMRRRLPAVWELTLLRSRHRDFTASGDQPREYNGLVVTRSSGGSVVGEQQVRSFV